MVSIDDLHICKAYTQMELSSISKHVLKYLILNLCNENSVSNFHNFLLSQWPWMLNSFIKWCSYSSKARLHRVLYFCCSRNHPCYTIYVLSAWNNRVCSFYVIWNSTNMGNLQYTRNIASTHTFIFKYHSCTWIG